MSRGAGKMQDHVLLWLGDGSTFTIAGLHSSLLNDPDFEGRGAKNHSRSLRNSLARAIRGLAKAGKIQQTPAGEWWIPGAAKELEKDRREALSSTAYHEAGHAVVSLAKGIPVELATIKPKGRYGGFVSHPRRPRELGLVYSHRRVRRGRGYSYKFIEHAKLADVDAFGNPVSPSPTGRDYHADIVICIAGGMAETEYRKGKDVRKWNELEGTHVDQSHIKDYRRKLGDNARKLEEYETECKALVTKHWPMIVAVANRLLNEETVGGSEILELCERIARNVVRRQHLKGKRR